MDKILFCFFLTRGLLSWALAEHTLKIDKVIKHDLKAGSAGLLDAGIKIHKNADNEDTKEEYIEKRNSMILEDKSHHFTVDVEELTADEKELEQKLFEIRREIVTSDDSPLFMEVHDAIDAMKVSKLFEVLRGMPKGAHLHYHIECPLSVEEFMEFTNDDSVYYSMKDDLLMTAKAGLNITGYRKCNDLRKDWKQSGTFDEYLRDKFTLNRQETKIKRSRKIWEHFEHKFDFINGLVHYHKFYKETLLKTSRNAIKDGVKILEIRHAFGRVFGDNYAKGKDVSEESKTQDISIDGLFEPISIKEELDLYKDVIDELKKEDPDFELILIVVAFKALGHPHAEEQISGYKYAIENGYDFVTGYDLVNEEDKVKPILYFIDELLEAKKNIPGFQFIFHAGESISRYNENLYDAILLGTKRIGHSVPLTFHPHLMKLSTKNQIGIEVCPISHWILGYIYDPRWHPARTLIAANVGVTVSSDVHTFYDYDTLTVDYVLAFLAWELDVKDLKQLVINSIKYSSIHDEKKQKYLDDFKEDWKNYVQKALKK